MLTRLKTVGLLKKAKRQGFLGFKASYSGYVVLK